MTRSPSHRQQADAVARIALDMPDHSARAVLHALNAAYRAGYAAGCADQALADPAQLLKRAAT